MMPKSVSTWRSRSSTSRPDPDHREKGPRLETFEHRPAQHRLARANGAGDDNQAFPAAKGGGDLFERVGVRSAVIGETEVRGQAERTRCQAEELLGRARIDDRGTRWIRHAKQDNGKSLPFVRQCHQLTPQPSVDTVHKGIQNAPPLDNGAISGDTVASSVGQPAFPCRLRSR